MPHASGSALYASINGTVITGDQRSLSWSDTQSYADTTAGSDPATSQVNTTYSVTGSINLVANGTDATAIYALMAPGTRGTLEWGTYGTAIGQPKYSIVVDFESLERAAEYASEMMVTVNWRNQGEWIDNFDREGSVYA